MTKYGTDFLVLRGKKIPVDLADLPQVNLHFYLENPRLYTLVRTDGRDPTQEEIEERLSTMDHVRQLVNSIKENGGLMDAIIVQGGTNVVLEGNSRLAAYRTLAKQDPIKWGKIKAKVLPESISESEIFSLLGEYHIIGKKDWAPYEQAGYLYRRHKTHGVEIPDLGKEINLSTRTIGHLIDVYQFMLDHDEHDVNRWSHYDEYLKSNKMKKAREQYPQLDTLVIKKIRSGEIPRAVDVRDELKKIVEAGGKVLDKFATGKRSFEDSVQAALHKGIGGHGVRHLRKFKEWLGASDTQAEISSLDGEASKECLYELKKIEALVSRLLRKLNRD
jgi:hypothetical protein